MNIQQEPAVNFVEPKYRLRIGRIKTQPQVKIGEGQRTYRLKLISCDDKQATSEKTLKQPAFSLRKLVNHTDLKSKITSLRNELKVMESELEEESQRRSRMANFKTFKTINSDVTLPNPPLPERLIFQPKWDLQPYSSRISRKRINRMHLSRIYNHQEDEGAGYFPIIEKYSQLKSYYESLPKSNKVLVTQLKSKNTSQLSIVRKYRTTKVLKRLRRIFNVVLFTIYLRTFNRRMRFQRKRYFESAIQGQVESRLLELKQMIIKASKPCFNAISEMQVYCGLEKSDEDKVRREKTRNIKRVVSLQVQCMKEFVREIESLGRISQLLYFLCKHGNYSCLYALNSPQELSLACISQSHGYMSCDSFLQKSAILSLLFLKLLLYNIFLQPRNTSLPFLTPIVCKNMQLAGNILYEVLIDVQDELLEASSTIYVIGNWQKYQHKFGLKTAESMVIGGHRGKEVISGLADHNYIRSTYDTREMHKIKGILRECLQQIHQMIVRHHLQVRQKCFL